MNTIETLTTTEPRYFMEKAKALFVHNTEGGKLWKRKEGVSNCIKPFATGDLPESTRDKYEVVSVDGRNPQESLTVSPSLWD